MAGNEPMGAQATISLDVAVYERLLAEDVRLREALSKIRKVLSLAEGDKAKYIYAALNIADAALDGIS